MAANGCEIGNRSCLQQQQVQERDRISELPNEILEEILSVLPNIKDVVKTSVLSKRWKSVWTSVRVVWIRERELFPNPASYTGTKKTRFVNFVESFFNHVLDLQKLELSCYNLYSKQWIDIVTNKLCNHVASLHELDLTLEPKKYDIILFARHIAPFSGFKLHPSIFTSKVLVVLKLNFKVDRLAWSSRYSSSIPLTVVWLPSLKVFHFTPIEMYRIDVPSMHNFLAGCPVLEELCLSGTLDGKNSTRLCVKSSSLKRLKLCFRYDSMTEIDASNLEELDLNFDQYSIVHIVNISQLMLRRVTLAISCFQCPDRETHVQGQIVYGNRLIELLTKVSSTKYLFLSSDAMACLENSGINFQQVPMFNALVDLKLDVFFTGSYRILHWFLERAPNLVSISICNTASLRSSLTDQVQYQGTHKCSPMMRLHHLEKVELKDFQGSDHEMKLVKYLLKKSPVLKEMICYVPAHMKEVASELLSRLVKLPKASVACQFTAL